MQLNSKDAVRREVRGARGKQRVGWIFACRDCGKELWITTANLAKHLGRCKPCSRSKFCRENPIRRIRPFESLYNSGLMRRAKLSDIPVSLTYEEFLTFTTVRECHYCGGFVTWVSHGRQSPNHGYHLDRKNSSGGYSLENCVVACATCNRIKNNHLSYEEMLCLSPVLRDIMAKRQRGQK